MPDEDQHFLTPSQLRDRAIARWENEGGAIHGGQGASAASDDEQSGAVPPLTNAELSQLHIRVIALEALVTALLADASDRQIKRVRDMAAYISPRPGFTQHPLTIRAANQMIDLLERSDQFRKVVQESRID